MLSLHIKNHTQVSKCSRAISLSAVTHINLQAPFGSCAATSRSKLDVSAKSDAAQHKENFFPNYSIIILRNTTLLKISGPSKTFLPTMTIIKNQISTY